MRDATAAPKAPVVGQRATIENVVSCVTGTSAYAAVAQQEATRSTRGERPHVVKPRTGVDTSPPPTPRRILTPPMDRALDILSLAAAYRRGETTATDVTQRLLERVAPGAVFRLVTSERALVQAARADALFSRGIDLGPLQGVPIGLKDLMDTRGDVTSAGSAVLERQAPAAEDCPVAA